MVAAAGDETHAHEWFRPGIEFIQKEDRVIRSAQALALVAAVTLLVAAPTVAAGRAPSVTQAAMATYLAKMRPLDLRYAVFADEMNSGIESVLNGDPAGLDDIRFAAAGIDGLASRMAKVRPPTELSGPHASFVRALRLQVSLARSVENFSASDDLQAARDKADRLGPEITDLERHWRDEVIKRLRRAGMTVPVWVKKVGADVSTASRSGRASLAGAQATKRITPASSTNFAR